MHDVLWIAVFAQMLMGGFDTLYHHEGTERLAWRPAQRVELTLHGVRNLAYAVLFATLGWAEPRGWWAVALLALLAGELLITLWDFVEEDRTRLLPASERVTHTLLTLNYGVILAMLVPWLAGLAVAPTDLAPVDHGVLSWLCAIAAAGVIVSGLRDLAAARRTVRLVDEPAADLAAALPGRQHILVTGGTGFVGQRLVAALASAGHQVTVLARKPAAARFAGGVRVIASLDAITDDTGIDAVVNLAGEPIASAPWTATRRRRIIGSRLAVTEGLVALIARLNTKPQVLVSGSAVGWYGLRGDEVLDESAQGAPCFSHDVCQAWENAACGADLLGVRTVRLRIGLVFDRSGGMLARLLTVFEFGLGARFGNGRQWMSWIHRDDLVRLIIHAIAHPQVVGAINAVAPEPVTNRRFTRELAAALHRPALLTIPGWPLRAVLGDFALELFLGGQRVIPAAALASGFRFRHPSLPGALAAIVGQPQDRAAQGQGLLADLKQPHPNRLHEVRMLR